MRDQRIIFTPLPHRTSGATLRVSVLVSPRLRTDEGGAQPPLSLFPDFVDWPSTAISWQVKIGSNAPVAATVLGNAPRSDLWAAIFAPGTFVRSFEFDRSLENHILSVPAARLRDYFRSLFGFLGGGFLTEPPTSHQLYDPYSEGRVLDFDANYLESLAAIARQQPNQVGNNAAGAIAKTLAFHTPRFDPETEPPPTVPTLDFHQAVSLLADQPVLMRVLGLLVDLSIPIPPGFPAAGDAEHLVQVIPSWTPKLTNPPVSGQASYNVLPSTKFDDAFLPGGRATDPIVANGMLRGEDPRFSLVDLDVDGAALKLANYVRTTSDVSRNGNADTPQVHPAPSIRSAGLSLCWDGRAIDLASHYQQTLTNLNAAAEATPPQPLTLAAEDIVRGWRLDVWDKAKKKWFQLCARTAVGGKFTFKHSAIKIPAPDDEGFVQLAITGGGHLPDSTGETLFLHESMARWEGWSLVAPHPGKKLDTEPMSPPTDPAGNPSQTPYKLEVTYAAKPGTLPALRFGHAYRMRARMVDLGGFGLPFTPAGGPGTLTHATGEVEYTRYEPVISPTLLKRARRTPGESTERLVIRSDLGATNGSINPCDRHLAPPMTSQMMAEQHGMFDAANGTPDPSRYALIAGRDGQLFTGGTADPGDSQDTHYFPTAALATPYLPDVFARAIGMTGLPRAGTGVFRVELYPAGRSWPAPLPVRLRLAAGTGAPQSATVGAGTELSVFLGQGEQAHVLIGSLMNDGDIDLMGHWSQSMANDGVDTAANRSLVRNGRSWMFTPTREIVLVHAVRRPLVAPRSQPLNGNKTALAQTYVDYTGKVVHDVKSTGTLELIGTWTEYVDALGAPAPTTPSAEAKLGTIRVQVEDSSPRVFGLRHEFHDTKHRVVDYRWRGVTRFTEYFEESKRVKLTGTTATLLDAAGVVAGTERVRSTDGKTTYLPGKDYALVEGAGTIARVAGSAITSGASVDVDFVAPPIDQTGAAVRVSVLNTSRPALPVVRSIMPAFDWRTDAPGAPPDSVVSRRTAGGLRIWLARPWWSSGEGELLGVLVAANGLQPDTIESAFTTRWGNDPIWSSRGVDAAPSKEAFTRAVTTMHALSVPERNDRSVDVAGHQVAFDTNRGLWYCDVDVDAGSSYFPFVRLALARFQPASLAGAHLSGAVVLDPIQLLPERTTIVSFSASNRRAATVSVKGRSYLDQNGNPGTVTIGIERRRPGVQGGDLGWTPVSDTLATVAKVTNRNLVTWKTPITLPADRGREPMRITVNEIETYSSGGSRLVYADSLEI